MTTEQNIPLNQLVHSKANVRRTAKTEGVHELAASIEAHGLRQNLNVLPTADGRKFEVVAGGRRLRALKRLAKAGKLAKDISIPCFVLGAGEDAAEISLAENAIRASIHPDDQFEAFRALIEEKGASVEDVAARFGVTPAVVHKRLKLAHVSPKLRALYRKGEMTLEHVMALAIRDDHAAQEEAWENLPEWDRDPALLKSALTHDAVKLTDKLARFVGVEAYQAAGGAVLRDLFDEEDEGYLSDRALLTRLATAKMEAAMADLQAEGWKWVKPELTRDYATPYQRVYPHGQDDETEDGAEATERAEPCFTDQDKARAGARLTLAHDGTLQIERGLIHPDDVRAEARRQRGAREDEAPGSGLPATMVEELTAHRTAALRIELARKPSIALAATVHALALTLLYTCGSQSCLDIRATSDRLERHTKGADESPAHQAMEEEGECWRGRLPEDEADLFAWCLAQPQDALLDLLAYLAALTVDAVEMKHGGAKPHAGELAQALSLDMTQWWTPSVEGFYSRVPKAVLTLAVSETKAGPLGVSLANLKKAEAARLAAGALAGSGWLPEPLRTPASLLDRAA